MYLGKFTIGEEVRVPLHATDNSPKSVSPTAAPNLKVFAGDGSLVTSGQMASQDTVRTAGLFLYRLLLATGFSTGRHVVSMSYLDGSTPRLKVCHFDIVAGGDPAATVLSLYALQRPQADTLVSKTSAGKRIFRQSPHL